MDWIKQNKFLSGFLFVTLLGAGLLGFLMFSAKGKYGEAYETYTNKIAELQGLQSAKPYPESANLKKMQELQKAHQEAINELQTKLAANELPVEPMTPEKFQDVLRETVKRVEAKRAEKGSSLGEAGKFYMGYERYQSEPPKPEAAPLLGRMLKAMEIAVISLLDAGASEIKAVKPEPLAEEGIASPGGNASGAGDKGEKKGDSEKGDEKSLARRQPFEIEFVANEMAFRQFLNGLITSKEQFFVPISVVVNNEQQQGPSKVAANVGAGFPPADPANPAAVPPGTSPAPAAAAKDRKFIVGDEKLVITVRVEVVDFAELTAK
jgi:hypothetical protein